MASPTNAVGRGQWYDYTWKSGIIPASYVGVLALGFAAASVMDATKYGLVNISGFNQDFTMIDLTETAEDPNGSTSYRGGIQSVDKSFSASPLTIPIPQELPVGFDIGFVESAVFTIAGVWFDGIDGRDSIMEDLRTSKLLIEERRQASPLIIVLSNRAYFVHITGYSSNIVGGQGNIVSFRLGLSICSGTGHYT